MSLPLMVTSLTSPRSTLFMKSLKISSFCMGWLWLKMLNTSTMIRPMTSQRARFLKNGLTRKLLPRGPAAGDIAHDPCNTKLRERQQETCGRSGLAAPRP